MTGHYKKDNENALCFKCNKNPRYPLQSYCYECAYEKGRIYITKKLEKKRLERAKIKVKTIKGEVWKEIKGYEHYKVSNKGRVISCMRLDSGRNIQQNEKLLKATIDSKGYRSVKLYKNGNKKTIKVHQLVAEAFVKKPIGKTDVHHKDANKLNNIPKNLQWVTKSEHRELTEEQGLFWHPKGEKHQNSKFTQIEANQIRSLYATNKYTQKQLAEMYSVNPITILRIINNQTYINEGA